MSVLLEFDGFLSATPSMLDFGGVLTPALGGEEQRVNRLGTRHQIAYVVEFDTDEEARRFGHRLRRAKSEGALVRFPQIGLQIGSPGSPLVDGVVAGGTTIPIKGLTPHYAIREGQFASIVIGGRRYLYAVDGQAIADASGIVEIVVTPTLRIGLDGDETVEIAKPMLEGLVDGDAVQWEHATHSHEPFAFTVREMA